MSLATYILRPKKKICTFTPLRILAAASLVRFNSARGVGSCAAVVTAHEIGKENPYSNVEGYSTSTGARGCGIGVRIGGGCNWLDIGRIFGATVAGGGGVGVAGNQLAAESFPFDCRSGGNYLVVVWWFGAAEFEINHLVAMW
ncbi:hypothetical protein ACP275_05G108400 [Erythranthe tilingii]